MFDQASPIQLSDMLFGWQPDNPVINIAAFELQAGSRCFLKGPSGSGKTTLLGLIGGVLEPQQGTVNILGTAINRLPVSQRDTFRANHIGYIFQMFNLIPYLSVLENVILPASFAPVRKERAIQQSASLAEEAVRLLNHLGLTGQNLIHRPVTELSIGQQQRVAAARALLGQPEIIIADEPTSALDSDSREAFLELLFEECRSAGSTLLFVSHDSALEGLFDQTVSLNAINRSAGNTLEAC
ncbi:ABC transporter ATP-binding protein [Kistimonas asteriae]|uniref:ABC transporter ATP-binding protein n=1 Tax=Kistimonas asteriae TaxID=517724 RepID=UPI001BA9C544|nr:ABC transporter ATP-binding protein [Kistimonas asteriae]